MTARRGPRARHWAAVALPLLWLAAVAPAQAQVGGVVFVDRDGDGERDPGEPGYAGARVSNGLVVAVSDAAGRYVLPNPTRGFVVLTRPDGFACERWYHREGGDFALTPAPAPDDFFFVHTSDAHVYNAAGEFFRYSLPPIPEWLPRWLTAQLMLWRLDGLYEEHTRGEIVGALRDAVQPQRNNLAGRDSAAVINAFLDEFRRPGSELGGVRALAARAFAEIAALHPSFVVSTGDHVLDANFAPSDVVLGWLGLYRELAGSIGVPVYHTLGNNELAAILRSDASHADPAYGRGAYESLFGPATYSFDRGAFHFAATDTHIPVPRDPEPPWWNFDEMEPGVRDWLDADLAAHADRSLVVLNHEPFFTREDWHGYEPASDAGLFAKHGVAYTIAGHTHSNGRARIGATTHIVSGALSGGRWLLPAGIHPRGYRLFYARGGRLYSAWKPLHEPVLGFVDPPGDPALAAASREPQDPTALVAPAEIVAVAADASGPFASLELRQDGRPIAFERWGEYFLRARVAPAPGRADAELSLHASDAAGAARVARLPLRFAAPTSAPDPRTLEQLETPGYLDFSEEETLGAGRRAN